MQTQGGQRNGTPRLGFARTTVFAASAFVLLLLAAPHFAAASPDQNRIFGYQLRLTDSSGVPVADGSYDVKVTIYDDSDTGSPTQVYTYCATTDSPTGTPDGLPVTFTGGIGTILVGDTTITCNDAGFEQVIPADLWENDELWLAVEVENDGEMTPYKRIVAAGYALNADRLDDLETSNAGGTDAFVPVTDSTGLFTLTGSLTANGNGVTLSPTISGTAATQTYYGLKQSITNNQTTNADTVYGTHISFTDAGSLANTVTGLYVDATTANTSDTTYSGVFLGGNFGIGDTTPASLLSVGSGDLFQVNSSGDVFSVFTSLDGSTLADGAGAATTTLTVDSTTNFNAGNYILVNSTYAKIVSVDDGTTMTISPALTWSDNDAVTEYHIPEVGGTNTASTLTNRYGRGYFIDGIVAGNGSTYYTDGGLTTTNGFTIDSDDDGTPEFTLDASGNLTVTGTIAVDANISGTNPALVFLDTNATAGDNNATIDTDCTDTGDGSEDCDVTFSTQIAGTLTSFLTKDADGPLAVAGDFEVAGELGLGDGSALSNATINIEDTFTTTGYQAGITMYMTPNPSGTTTNSVGGVDVVVDTTLAGSTAFNNPLRALFGDLDISHNGTVGAAYGAQLSVSTYSGSADITDVKTVSAGIDHGGTGDITNAYHLYVEGTGLVGSTGNVVNRYGLYVEDAQDAGGGALTNNYAIYLDSVEDGATLNYALYSAGGQSYHAGNFGIGDTTPASLLSVGSGDLFQVNSSGDVFSVFTSLDGSTLADGAGAATTTLTVDSTTNFNAGNYILVNSTYAKIVSVDDGTTMTISPALTWSDNDAVTEYHIPEVGGTNTASTLTNRYGRGYFIDGVVAGNGSTYFTDGSITTTNGFTIDADNDGSAEFILDASGDLTVASDGAFELAAGIFNTPYGGMGAWQNKLKRSEEFDNAAWTKTANTTVNDDNATAPDGTVTADTITFAADAATDDISQATTLAAASETVTGSVWLKGTDTVRIGLRGSSGGTPESATTTVTPTSTWRRYSHTQTFTGSATGNVEFFIDDATDTGAVSVDAWGAQVNQGSVPYVYVPTSNVGFNNLSDFKGLVAQGLHVVSGQTSFDNSGNLDLTTDTQIDITAGSLSTGKVIELGAASGSTSSGVIIDVTENSSSGVVARTGSTLNIDQNRTWSGGVGLSHTGNVVDFSRDATLNATGQTHTLSGAVLAVSDDATQTDGTLTHTANVLSVTQSYAAATGAALSITNSGTGADILGNSSNWSIGSDGTFTTEGDVVGTFVTLDGSTLADGAGAATTTLTVDSTTNFNAGNYILVNSTYAKIVSVDDGTTMTISPALTWSDNDAVTEHHIPEVGGTNTASTLANRFGRGYFIDGVVTGNGTTYFTDGQITATAGFAIDGDDDGTDDFTIDSSGDLSFAGTLTVADDAAAYLLSIANDGNASTRQGIELQGCEDTNPTSGCDYITLKDGDGDVVGQIEGNGSGGTVFTGSSDARLKENIIDYRGALDVVLGMQVRKFNFISAPGKSQVGFVAQEMYEVFPEVVSVGGEDTRTNPWGINFAGLTPILTGAVQELSLRIDDRSEMLPSAEMLEAGEIVMVDPMYPERVRRSLGGEDAPAHLIAGVVTRRLSRPTEDEGVSEYPVAFGGRVMTRVVGQVSIGDPVTISLTDGVGVVAEEPAYVVGYALETKSTLGPGEVLVMIRAEWWNGNAHSAFQSGSFGGEIEDFGGSALLNVKSIESAGGVWSIDDDGALIVGDIDALMATAEVFAVKATDDQQTVGEGTILVGNSQIIVDNPAVHHNSRIFVTFYGNIEGTWWISRRTDGQFEISLSSVASADIPFEYWILDVIDERTPPSVEEESEGDAATEEPATEEPVAEPATEESEGIEETAPSEEGGEVVEEEQVADGTTEESSAEESGSGTPPEEPMEEEPVTEPTVEEAVAEEPTPEEAVVAEEAGASEEEASVESETPTEETETPPVT